MKHYVISLLSLLLFACSSLGSARPDWIENPGNGAVGSAGTHVMGRHAQEELAIARARERLAARLGVAVSSVQTIQESVANDNLYVSSDKEIHQVISDQTVEARIRATWHDKERDEFWAWVYPVR